MKSRQLSFLVIGLLSFGAMVREAKGQSNLPLGAPSINAAARPLPAPKAVEAPDRQELSLAFGTFFARYDTNYLANNFGMDEKMDLDMGKVIEGFTNFMASPGSAMPWEQVTNILNRQVAYLREKIQGDTSAMMAAGPETKAKGIKFLEENATAPGVTRLTNGVEYKVIKEGDGVLPTLNDLATLNLTAKLIDGTEVGSLAHRELPVSNLRPAPPAVSQVLTNMKAGSHWLIYLPYDLAYGDKPALSTPLHAPKVPPYSAMIFDVELEAVRPAPPPPATAPAGSNSNRLSLLPQPKTDVPAKPVVRAPFSQPMPQTSSDIVRVPSAEEMKRGSNIEVMTLDQAIKRSQQTNAASAP
ncbi:MAG: FKBP-type peptidyl-prolyl cis-trans isomerase N-terminal domain-containing protein [Verrucomicrobiota bacterium]|jgi:FKBP-type peptidyl-prolyl cis-trans isomerase